MAKQNNYAEFRDRLFAAMQKRNVNATKLAKSSGVTKSRISQVLKDGGKYPAFQSKVIQ